MSGPASMSDSSPTDPTMPTDTETSADTESETSSSGGENGCDPTDTPLAWGGGGFELLEAVAANQRFVGVGRCAATPAAEGTMALTCTMDGRRDGVEFEQEELSFPITLQGAVSSQEAWSTVTLSDFGARLVLESGFEIGAERWFIAESQFAPDDGVMPGVILTDAFRVAPPGDLYSMWFDGSWFDGPGFSVTDASCGFLDGECGSEARALEAGWAETFPSLGHEGEYFEFFSPFEETWFGVWPGAVWDVPEPSCLDFPVSKVQFVSVAQTP